MSEATDYEGALPCPICGRFPERIETNKFSQMFMRDVAHRHLVDARGHTGEDVRFGTMRILSEADRAEIKGELIAAWNRRVARQAQRVIDRQESIM